jgi:hypothetical protein
VAEEPEDLNLPEVKEEKKTLVAKFEYKAEGERELSINVGDELEHLETKDGWTSVINKVTKATGWVPQDFIGEKE